MFFIYYLKRRAFDYEIIYKLMSGCQQASKANVGIPVFVVWQIPISIETSTSYMRYTALCMGARLLPGNLPVWHRKYCIASYSRL